MFDLSCVQYIQCMYLKYEIWNMHDSESQCVA